MPYRMTIGVALFVAFALLFTAQPSLPAAAGDKTTEANLRNEVAQLKQQVKELQTTNSNLNTQAQNAQKAQTDSDKNAKTLQTTLDGYRGAGLIHVVVLKAKDDTASSDTQSLIDDSYSQLAKIKGVRGLWAGKPSSKGTPDAASDYTVALVLAFDDAAGLKTYLNDSAHTKFADKYLKKYETPVVYDYEPRKAKP